MSYLDHNFRYCNYTSYNKFFKVALQVTPDIGWLLCILTRERMLCMPFVSYGEFGDIYECRNKSYIPSVKSQKRLFQSTNGMGSTLSLVKIHNRWSLHFYPLPTSRVFVTKYVSQMLYIYRQSSVKIMPSNFTLYFVSQLNYLTPRNLR